MRYQNFKSQIRGQDIGPSLQQVTATLFCQWHQVLDMPRSGLPDTHEVSGHTHEVSGHNLKRSVFLWEMP